MCEMENGSSTSFDNLTNLEKSKLYDGFAER